MDMTPWKHLRNNNNKNARMKNSSEAPISRSMLSFACAFNKYLSNANSVLDWGRQIDTIFCANSHQLVVAVQQCASTCGLSRIVS